MDPATVVCRCCEVTLAEILAAIQEGAASIDEVKRRTRAGMGLCQGKTCATLVQRILANAAVETGGLPIPSTRAPVRPTTLEAIAGLTDAGGSA
jgi:NAD(P)H-nitrite reductase large subunit